MDSDGSMTAAASSAGMNDHLVRPRVVLNDESQERNLDQESEDMLGGTSPVVDPYEHGLEYLKRYDEDLAMAHLEKSIASLQLSLDKGSKSNHFKAQCKLAEAFRRRWARLHNVADLNQCIELYSKVLAPWGMIVLDPSGSPLQRDLATAVVERWRYGKDGEGLNLSIEIFTAILQNCPNYRERSHDRAGLCRCLYERWRKQSQIYAPTGNDLERIIDILASIVEPEQTTYEHALQQAMTTYNLKWKETLGPLKELRDLIPMDLLIFRNVLDTYESSGRRDDLDETVDLARMFIPHLTRGHPWLPNVVSELGRALSCLVKRYDMSTRLRYLNNADLLIQDCRVLLQEPAQSSELNRWHEEVKARRVPIIVLSKKGLEAVDGGGFCDIFRGQVGNQLVAVKMRRETRAKEKANELLEREVHLWYRVKHKHILRVLGISQENGIISIISPWCSNGNCMEYMKAHPNLNKRLLLCQVAEALVHLHTFSPRPIVHGDIKGDNVLIDGQGNALLCDFGLSRLELIERSPDDTQTASRLAEAGSIRFMAPELLEEKVSEPGTSRSWSKTTNSDVFAYGRLILQVVTGQRPFANVKRDVSIVTMVTRGLNPTQPPNFPEQLWSLCLHCWTGNPEERPLMKSVLQTLQAV